MCRWFFGWFAFLANSRRRLGLRGSATRYLTGIDPGLRHLRLSYIVSAVTAKFGAAVGSQAVEKVSFSPKILVTVYKKTSMLTQYSSRLIVLALIALVSILASMPLVSVYEARKSGFCSQRHSVTSETPAASAASFVAGWLSSAMIAFSCLVVTVGAGV